MACASFLSVCTLWSMGRIYARVFPLPVMDWPIISLFSRAGGIAASCMAVGDCIFSFFKPSIRLWFKPNLLNDVSIAFSLKLFLNFFPIDILIELFYILLKVPGF
ncbi:hypothetical protein SDC9_191769 [bioreactor metagenome]|uniref:Uncharacterized protein n=1 Tax=bioreactor metagenome TaxID=1076179 RepID=A0A645HYX7_9ZZZZ